MSAELEGRVEVSAEESGFGRSSWLQRKYRRLVISAVVSGALLSVFTRALLQRRKAKEP